MSERPRSSRQVEMFWFGLMAIGGFAFGLIAERRPFGEGVLVHPLVVFFIVAGGALLALRIATARPVPDTIPDRALILGCVAGLAAFLIGNFFGVRVLALL